jgi:uncharacterized membrane protein YkvA (DUF1232 family)
MSLKITFDLEEKDLKYFREIMTKAQKAATQKQEEEIIGSAEGMLRDVRAANVPAFVVQRLERLERLIAMLQDDEWRLEAQERKDVVTALTYFAEAEDLIPDNIPVLGYIDDAIMIELVVKELTHEIEAFDDFCRYREMASKRKDSKVTREEWLEAKRRELHQRMRRRRQKGGVRIRRRGGSSTRFRLF